jgi:UPF0755 protein
MRSPRTVIISLGVVLAVFIAVGIDFLIAYPKSKGPGNGVERLVEVEKGVGPRRLATGLHERGVISSPYRFALWLRLSDRFAKVQAGTFRVRDDATPIQVVEALAGEGVIPGIRVTIPEGQKLSQVGDALQAAGVVTRAAFIRAATDRALLSRLGIVGPTAEGYLFPDTYFFDASQGASEVVEIMHANFNARLADLGKPKPPDLRAMVILASIVQAEARVAEEMPIIAGVYVNRLTNPEFPSRLLQADPTVSYGCEPFVTPRGRACDRFTGVLTRHQLIDQTNPYNTYVHPGLPPGPICAPGMSALKAAAAPKKVPYLFFVAEGSGRHAFSSTLKEHQQAVDRYRKSL